MHIVVVVLCRFFFRNWWFVVTFGWMVCVCSLALGGAGSCVDALWMISHLDFYLECGFIVSTRGRVEFKCGGV